MSELHRDRLALAALGVVYGDIGTSPVYALKACFTGDGPVTPGDVLGVISLVLWTLFLTVTVKYLSVVMNADNKGEGGIAALVALLNPWRAKRGSQRYLLMIIGLFGGALLFGDATITPSISVLSAIEGLRVATPAFNPFVIPLTLGILLVLFVIQRRGTGGIGGVFGPIMVIWFLGLAAAGLHGILANPAILRAINPLVGVWFLIHSGVRGFVLLGAVFLVVTGAEALYADMGHFGLAPIRRAWYVLVMPSLALNYLGQGALILSVPDAAVDPFYRLIPATLIYPAVGLAAAATVIASQAVISGSFSLVRQLVQLGQFPRMNIVQTSSEERGQVYIPIVNWLLMIATFGLVLGFRTSDALSAAYGIAVSATMVVTTVLAFFVARRFDWNPYATLLLTVFFLAIDLTFFASNIFKVADGGWYPLLVAILIFTLMTTWSRGRSLLATQLFKDTESLEDFVRMLRRRPPHRIPGTAVFFTQGKQIPPRLVWHLQRHRVLQEQLVLVAVEIEDVPRVPSKERVRVIGLTPGIHRVVVQYGFMQEANIPVALRLCRELGLDLDLDEVTYYVGHETIIASRERPGMWLWRERLFAILLRNAMRPTAFYRLPPEDVVELGFQVEI